MRPREPIHGLMAEFETAPEVLEATTRAWQAGYRRTHRAVGRLLICRLSHHLTPWEMRETSLARSSKKARSIPSRSPS